MRMAAPDRLSMTTGFPHLAESCDATRRAVASMEPPGEVGTMMRTVRSGKACPAAGDATADMASAATTIAAEPQVSILAGIVISSRVDRARQPAVCKAFK